MSEDHTAEREAFEAWYSAEDQETDDPERTYELTEEGTNELTKYCIWQGWQARAAAPAQERIQALELEVRQLTEQIAGLRHAPTPQADSQPAPLSRQQICDKFSFLEGMVNEWGFDRIVSRAEEIQARAIAARAQAYIAPAGGLVSVPSEPTAEMYRAAQKFVYSTGEDGGSIVLNTSQVRALWQAMRAAAASTAVSVSEPVFAFRRKGLDDFCTCTEKRYAELSAKPNLFETRIFYTTPPTQAADSVLEDAETALRKVLGVVQRYLPPDGPSAHDAMSEIIAIVDPWPLGPLEKP